MDYGVYVELDNTCEGLIRTDCLPEDDYVLTSDGFTLKGSSHQYTIGDEMQIKVATVNIENYKIDFVLAQHELGIHDSKHQLKKTEYEQI